MSALRAWLDRAGRASFAGALGGMALSAADASFVAEPTLFTETWLADLGLVAPVALPVSFGVATLLVLLRPDRSFTRSLLARELGTRDESSAYLGALIGLSFVAAGLFLAAAADLGRHHLASTTDPKAAGATLAVSLVSLAVALGFGVFLLARRLRKRLAKGPHPLVPITLGLLVLVAIVGYGVTVGGPGGEGSTLAVFGVLKRAELDLRGVAVLLGIGLCAALGEGLLLRVPGIAALSAAFLPLAFTTNAALTLDAQPTVAASLERAPLGKLPLAIFRKITDKDHDGKARTFGGGDCNDRDASVYPGAVDIPGNGLDEDCSGGDTPVPPKGPPLAVVLDNVKTAVPTGYNVILVTVDTLRADLGFAGNPRPVSPRLDVLAKQSIVFENAYSLASYTGKSIGPLMSGKYPSETHRGWSHFNTYGKEDTMVAERLQAAGVKTRSVQAHWYLEKCCGLARGFDKVDLSAMPAGLGADADTGSSGQKLTDNAIAALSDESFTAGRFFTWVHYMDPHADYVKHEGVPEFGKTGRDAYDGEVAFVDGQVGRLLDFVAGKPWGKKTIIVLTSDHGEAFGEHTLIRHGFEVWEELVRVPLIVHVPDAPPRRIKERRSGIDLVPTLLDLYDVKIANQTPNDFVSGTSLTPDLFGAAPPAPRDLFVDMPAGPNNQERRALYSGDKKLYVQAGTRFMLFDLGQDPGETKDLAATDKAALADMRAKYDAFRAGLKEVVVRPQ